MAGKTHSKHIVVTYNSQLITCSIESINGVGVSFNTAEVTTLCNTIIERLAGMGDVSITASGPFNDTTTTGAHKVIEPLNGSNTGATLVIDIGSGATPTTGDARFTLAAAGVDNYTVSGATGNAVQATWTWTPRPGATAAWSVIG